MRRVAMLALVGCGRIGFEPEPPDDGGGAVRCSGFEAGTFQSTLETSEGVELVAGAGTGVFEGAVCDGGGARWKTVGAVTRQPYGKPLLVTSESGYPTGNLDSTGLVAYWPLDGALGSVAAGTAFPDLVGSATVTASISQGSIEGVAGRISRALRFHPDPALLTNAGTGTIQFGGSFTYALWINTVQRIGTNNIDGAWIIDKDIPNCAPDYFIIIYQGKPYFWTECDLLVSDTDIADGAWHHLAFTRDVSTGTKRIYVDGAEVATGTGSVKDITNSEPFALGGDEDSSANQLDGSMDEVAAWSRVLSAAEIAALHGRGAHNLLYQVRPCDEPTCAGVPFRGPDGTAATEFSETDNSGPNPPVFDVSGLTGRYLQVRVRLISSGTESPVLTDLKILTE